MNIARILRRAAGLYPQEPAVVCGDRRLTYRELDERVRRLAAVLDGLGVQDRDRVAVLLPNCLGFLELYFAAPLVGAILMPLNHRLSVGELKGILDHGGASLLVSSTRYRDKAIESLSRSNRNARALWLAEPGGDGAGADGYEDLLASAAPVSRSAADRVDERDPAQIYYTSGTTGLPKGVVLTHGNVCHHALMAVAELGLSDRDVWLHGAPLFHLADAWAAFAVTWTGGRHVCCRDFHPPAVLDLLEAEGVTLTNLVPTMLSDLLHHPGAKRDYPGLRLMLSGGAPMAPELARRVMDTFQCDYWQTYGLTETSPYLTLSRPTAAVAALPPEERFWYASSTGRPMVGVEVRVVDEAGRDVPADRRTVGEVVARGPSVTPGYWRDPEETARAFRDGWFHTGDLAVLDERGYLNIVDRKKDVIITGGEQVFSVEVEKVLAEHPAVREVAVVSAPDEKWGESIRAVVVPAAPETVEEADLIAWCKERLARYKAPRAVDLVDALPRTGSGKVEKRTLRDRYWKGREKRVN